MDALSRSYPGVAPDDPLVPLLDSMAARDEAMNANVTALSDAIKGVAVLPPDGVAKLGQAAATGADRRAADLARAHNLRTMLLAGAGLAAAFVLGVVLDQAVTYARAPSYQTVTLAGDALLCRASGAVIDPSGVRYYPALPMQPAPVGRR